MVLIFLMFSSYSVKLHKLPVHGCQNNNYAVSAHSILFIPENSSPLCRKLDLFCPGGTDK